METHFDSKHAAREHVWERLEKERLARFPFPPRGRIPNFKGAEAAAERLLAHAALRGVKRIKVNPDAPQRPLRAAALRSGITIYVPTPRLKGGFKRFDPSRIPPEAIDAAASLSKGGRWAEPVALADLPQLDLIVAGSVAVTRDGRRAGKGEGYSDLEYAILRELGHDPVPVVTTVHDAQIVDALPAGPYDLPLSVIATPERIVDVDDPPAAPAGIDWSRLTDEDLEEMPVLAELKSLRERRAAE